MADKIVIASLDIDIDSILQSQATYIQQIETLRSSQKELKKDTDNLTDATDEQAKQYIQNDAELKKLQKTYNDQKAVLAEATTGTKSLSDALTKENQTVKDASKNNRELIKLRSTINAKTKEGQKAIEQVNSKIDDNNKFIKENVSQLEQQRINIGNYVSALDRVVPGLGAMATGLEQSAGKAKLFGNALKAVPIFAVLAAITALVSAFASTQSGIDQINASLAPLRGGFQSIIGVVQDLAVNIFSQVTDRWTLAKNGIISGINDIRIKWNELTNDIEEADGLKEYNRILKEESTAAQERLNEKTQAFSDIWDQAGDRIAKAADDYREIERLQVAIERAQIDTLVPLKQMSLELREQKQLAEDASKTDEVRLAANLRAVELQKQITATEQANLDLQIRQLELKNSLNDTSREDELALQTLIGQRIEAETAGVELLTTLQNQRNTVIQQGLAKEAKKVADQLKHQADLEREFQDAKAEAEAIRFEERLLNLQNQGASEFDLMRAQAVRESELRSEKARQTIEDETILGRQLQLIAAETEAAITDIQGIELDQRRSNMISTLDNIQGAFGKHTAASKAAGVAIATVNTYQGITEVLKTPSILLEPFATIDKIIKTGLVLKTGLSAVGKINSTPVPTKFAKGGLQEIGGKRHSQGGTKFYGEDGTTFEAEQGELIGVMNRNASKLFMQFNDAGLNGQYANMFGMMSGVSGGSSMSDKGIRKDLQKGFGKLANKPGTQIIIGENGLEYYTINGMQRTRYINNQFFGKS